MENACIPFLCGGTFFCQLLRARKDTKSPAEYRQGKKESLSEPEMFRRLIEIFQLKEVFSANSSLKTNASEFKHCKNDEAAIIGFNDYDRRIEFTNDIQKADSQALSRATQLIHDFIDPAKYEQLSRCLLGLIQEDSSIPEDEKFFIYPEQVEKRDLIGRTEINLPALILGVWHFIALNRRHDNQKGAATYHNWFPRANNEYCGQVGGGIQSYLTITSDIPCFSSSAKADYVQPTAKEQNSETDHESQSSSEGKNNSSSRTQIIQNATVVNQYGENNVHIDHVDTINF